MLGSDLAKQLRSQGFAGLILMRSASSLEDFAGCLESGVIDGCLGKETSNRTLCDEIKAAYVDKRGPAVLAPLGLTKPPSLKSLRLSGGTAHLDKRGRGANDPAVKMEQSLFDVSPISPRPRP